MRSRIVDLLRSRAGRAVAARRYLLVCTTLMVALAATAAGSLAAKTRHSEVDQMKRALESPQARAQSQAGRKRMAAKLRRRSTPAARKQRLRSRSVYGNATRRKAIAIAKAKFRLAVTSDVWSLPSLRNGERITGYEGDSVVRVAAAGMRGEAVVESSVPVRARDEQGNLQPVELALEDGGQHLESEQPIVPVQFYKDARKGARFERTGVTVRPAGIPASAATDETVVDDRLYFANVYADTDYWVTPTPGGFETHHLLRSAESPENLGLDLDVPDGARVRLSDDGFQRVEIVDADGRVRVGAPAPSAIDADGVSVPARYSLEGDRLTINVAHRAGDYAYPIAVDPDFIEGYNWSGGGENGGGEGSWYWHAPWGAFVHAWQSGSAGHLGQALYMGSNPGQPFWSGLYAQYMLYPQRSGVRIPRMDVQTSLDNPYGWFSVYSGIYTGGDNGASREHFGSYSGYFDESCVSSPDCGWDNSNGQYAYVGIRSWVNGTHPGPYGTWAAIRQAYVFNWDNNLVVNEMEQYGTRPWAHSDSIHIGAGGSDNGGIGMRRVSYVTDDGFNGEHVANCQGTRTVMCPEGLVADFTIPTGTTEGSRNAWGTAEEKIGRTVTKQLATFRVDRSKPSLTLTGGTLSPTSLSQHGNWISGGQQDIQVRSHDNYSGVRGIELYTQINGTWTSRDLADNLKGTNQICDSSSGCAADLDRVGSAGLKWTPSTSDPEGVPITIDTVARDPVRYSQGQYASDHVAEQSYDVKIDRTKPDVSVAGAASSDGAYVGNQTYPLDATASDGQSGVKRIELFVDGQPTGTPVTPTCGTNCPASAPGHWDLDGETLTHGDHAITVRAYDQITGQCRDATWTVKKDSFAPATQTSGSLNDSEGDTISGDPYELEVHATDGESAQPESGVKSVEVKLDGAVQGTTPTQACPQGNCPLDRNFSLDPQAILEGDHFLLVTVTDVAGNTSTSSTSFSSVHVAPQPLQTITIGPNSTPRADGAAAGDSTARSVASLGDLNGDAVADFVVGAPRANQNAGAAFVVYGSSDTTTVDLADMGTHGYRIDGDVGDYAGAAVADAGDVNGDGRDDVLIGAPSADPDATSFVTAQGKAYIVFGKDPVDTATVDLASASFAGFKVLGPIASLGNMSPDYTHMPTTFGLALSNKRAGSYATGSDVNGDGLEDIVIGSSTDSVGLSPLAGSAFVIYGKADRALVNTATLGNAGYRITGSDANDLAGYSVTIPGDINADGLADVVVTAPGESSTGVTAGGSAHVVYGQAGTTTGQISLAALGGQGFSLRGAAGDRVGSSAAAPGNIDGDDFADFVIGGARSYVVYGQSATGDMDLATVTVDEALRVASPGSNDAAVTGGAGDANGDQIPDVLFGFPNEVYEVYVPQRDKNFDLDSLDGGDGRRFVGTSPDVVIGQALDSLDADADQQPALVFGAPAGDNNARTDSGSAFTAANVSAPPAGLTPGATSGSSRCPASRRPFNAPKDQLACRQTVNARRDVAVDKRKEIARAVRLPALAVNQADTAEPKRARWPVVDSFNRTIAIVESTAPKQFKVYSPDEPLTSPPASEAQDGANPNFVGRTDTRYAGFVQPVGKACMATPTLTNSHVLVVFTSGRSASRLFGGDDEVYGQDPRNDIGIKGTQRPNIGFRGFVPRGALPAFPDQNTVFSRTSGCGTRARTDKLSSTLNLVKQGFNLNQGVAFEDARDVYQGRSAMSRCDRLHNDELRNCGGYYANYFRPPFLNDVFMLTSATTGVQGGGIVRAIVRSDTPFQTLDRIGYADNNVPCEQHFVAKWRYGRMQSQDDLPGEPAGTKGNFVYGWFPDKVTSDGTSRDCP